MLRTYMHMYLFFGIRTFDQPVKTSDEERKGREKKKDKKRSFYVSESHNGTFYYTSNFFLQSGQHESKSSMTNKILSVDASGG